MSESKGSRFFEGLVVGGLFGLTIGLLVAPRPGEDMRRLVGARVQEMLAKFDQSLRESRDAIEIALAEGKQTADETRKEVSQAIKQATEDVEKPK